MYTKNLHITFPKNIKILLPATCKNMKTRDRKAKLKEIILNKQKKEKKSNPKPKAKNEQKTGKRAAHNSKDLKKKY